MASMRIEHKDVGDVGKRGEIADYPRKADLSARSVINSEAQRICAERANVSNGICFAQ